MDRNHVEGRPAQVVVIGGGLAGLAAACELADKGCRVTLLEKRPYLGGRAYSFQDKATGAEIDNGQHFFTKCCTYYIDFLKRLGVYDRTWVQKRVSVPVVDARGRRSTISRAPLLPAPFHLLPSLLAYRHLGWGEKLGILSAALAMKRLSEEQRRQLDSISFRAWLEARGQSERVIRDFWDMILVPILNDASGDVSAAQAIMIFQEGFLRGREGLDIGLSRVGLSSLLSQEARRHVEGRGGCVLLGQHVAALEGNLEGIEGAVVHGGRTYRADLYILAVPPNCLLALLPRALREHEFFSRAGGLAMSPIVNLHLWLDRPVTDLPFAAYLESDIQWLFNKNAISAGDGAQGQYLVISVSAAHKYVEMSKDALYGLLVEDLHRRVPASREARVLHYAIVKERFATFAPAPGSASRRPTWRTPVPNLFLAGEWTDTGWPSTMESAVRSGLFCAWEAAKGS